MLNHHDYVQNADLLFAHVEACWRSAKGQSEMPRRADINPIRLGSALPFVLLIDVIPGDPVDFEYRLVGEHIIQHAGQNFKGKRCSELPRTSPTTRPIFSSFQTCCETRAAVRDDQRLLNLNGTVRRLQWQVLPLSDDGKAVTGLLAAAAYQD